MKLMTVVVALVGMLAPGCGSDGGDPVPRDAMLDAAAFDGGAMDGAAIDGGIPDAATADAAASDAAMLRDGSAADAGLRLYDSDGPQAFTTMTATVNTGTRTFTVQVYLPSSAVAHPVVSLSPGLQQPATGYVSYGRRLASHGIIALLRDDPGFTTTTGTVTDDITYLVATWLPAENARAASALFGKVDLAHVGLAGHSRGSKASLLAAELGLKGKVVGWFGLDPVDTAAFAGDVQARTTLATVGIPTVFFGASVSSTCSPAADNHSVLYAAAAAPAVQLVGVGAGHTQFEDPAGCAACALCTPGGTANGAVVLATAVRYLTAFFARELLADPAVGATFQGAGSAADVAAGVITLNSK